MTRDPAAAWPAVTTLVVPHLIAVSLAGDTWLFGDDWRDAPQTAFRIEPGPSGGTLGCALYLHGPTLRAPSQPPGPPRRPSGRFGEVVLTGAAAGPAVGARAGPGLKAQML